MLDLARLRPEERAERLIRRLTVSPSPWIEEFGTLDARAEQAAYEPDRRPVRPQPERAPASITDPNYFRRQEFDPDDPCSAYALGLRYESM